MGYLYKHIILLILCLLQFSCSGNSTDPGGKIPGYIEGQYTYIASGVSGTLTSLNVVRGQPITQGDLLYKLDPQPEAAAMAAAKATLNQNGAQLELTRIQYERQTGLFKADATAKSDLDTATANYAAQQQLFDNSLGQLIQAMWAYQQKIIYAPTSGIIFDTFFRVGEKVPLNQPVLAILAPENILVLFYIPEPKLSQIKLGQTIRFTCDSCQAPTSAIINYISPEAEYTPPVIYSKDTRYKLVFLVRARMPREVAQQFHPGQPIDVLL